MRNKRKEIENIAANEVNQYIDKYKNNCILIDVRDKNKYRIYHINGAINIYYKDIVTGNHQLPKDKNIIVYCDRGGLSMIVAKYLVQNGYSVKNVVGGLSHYVDSKN